VLVPGIHPGRGGHNQDSQESDEQMQDDAAGTLDQHEVSRERQEYAKAENLQGMLAAQDQWPEPE
jgi:hypothetical protein